MFNAKGKRIGGMWVRVPSSQIHSESPCGVWAVFDSDKRRVRGLWYRFANGPFYAQVDEKTPKGGRRSIKVPLDADTLARAREAHRRLVIKSKDGELPVFGKTPPFDEYAREFIGQLQKSGKKRKSTVKSYAGHVKNWCAYFSDTPLARITYTMIESGLEWLVATRGVKPRTVNLHLVTLRNVFMRAKRDGWIKTPPYDGEPMWREVLQVKRPLFTPEELDRLCEKALSLSRNGRQFVDFMLLMCFSGGRMAETLRLRWCHVDWGNEQIVIGADGLSKGKKPRMVNFNGNLAAHLKEMHSRQLSDEWLFPSAQRGLEGEAARSFRETLLLAREAAGLGTARKERTGFAVGFHDARHFFASHVVMSGTDFKTAARWLGHTDDGILLAQVYSHLSDEHAKQAAKRVTFGPIIIEGQAAA